MQPRSMVTILLIFVVVSAFITSPWALAAKASKAKSKHIRVNVVPPKSRAVAMRQTARVSPPTWQAQPSNVGATTMTTCYPGWVTAGYVPSYSWNVPATAGSWPTTGQVVRQPTTQPVPAGQAVLTTAVSPTTQVTTYHAPMYCYTCTQSQPQTESGWNLPAASGGLPPAVPYTRPVQAQAATAPSAGPTQSPVAAQQPQPTATTTTCFDPVQWFASWWRSVNSGTSCVNYACAPACY